MTADNVSPPDDETRIEASTSGQAPSSADEGSLEASSQTSTSSSDTDPQPHLNRAERRALQKGKKSSTASGGAATGHNASGRALHAQSNPASNLSRLPRTGHK